MSIAYRLCPLSSKRLALIETDTDLVNDLDEETVPELLDLGPAGFELDAILLFVGRGKLVRDAVFAQSGRELGEAGAGIRVHTAERVAEIHAALAALPDDTVARHFEAARGALGSRLPAGPDSVRRFTDLFERLRAVYAQASASGSGMLTFMV